MGKVKNYYHDEIVARDIEPSEYDNNEPDEVEQPSHDTLTLTIPFLPDGNGNYMDQANDLWVWKREMDLGDEGEYYYEVANRYTSDTYKFHSLEDAKQRFVREWVRMRSGNGYQYMTLPIK